MVCPRCAAPLAAVRSGRALTVDYCSHCGGTWLDKGELERVLGRADSVGLAPTGSTVEPPRACPRCREPLAEVAFPGDPSVRVDACGACGGHWLDPDEIRALRSALNAPQRFAEVPAEGRSTFVPVRIEDLRRARYSWGWIAGGAVVTLIAQGAVTGLLQTLLAIRLLDDTAWTPSQGLVLGAGALLGFPAGGFVVGWRSAGFTVFEPAVSAVPAGIAFVLLFGARLGTPALLGLLAAGFVLATAGALVGERFGAD